MERLANWGTEILTHKWFQLSAPVYLQLSHHTKKHTTLHTFSEACQQELLIHSEQLHEVVIPPFYLYDSLVLHDQLKIIQLIGFLRKQTYAAMNPLNN